VSNAPYVLACGASPTADLVELIRLANGADWDVFVGTTPAGWDFLDVVAVDPRRVLAAAL
jgi:hypothetical protein